jgi:hypothetical protein
MEKFDFEDRERIEVIMENMASDGEDAQRGVAELLVSSQARIRELKASNDQLLDDLAYFNDQDTESRMTICELRNENDHLRENQKRLLKALRSLYDGQAYQPKESDFYTWNRAMDFADIVLRDLEADDE